MAATLSPPVAEAADEPRTIYIALPQVQTRRGYLVFKRCFDFTLTISSRSCWQRCPAGRTAAIMTA